MNTMSKVIFWRFFKTYAKQILQLQLQLQRGDGMGVSGPRLKFNVILAGNKLLSKKS